MLNYQSLPEVKAKRDHSRELTPSQPNRVHEVRPQLREASFWIQQEQAVQDSDIEKSAASLILRHNQPWEGAKTAGLLSQQRALKNLNCVHEAPAHLKEKYRLDKGKDGSTLSGESQDQKLVALPEINTAKNLQGGSESNKKTNHIKLDEHY